MDRSMSIYAGLITKHLLRKSVEFAKIGLETQGVARNENAFRLQGIGNFLISVL